MFKITYGPGPGYTSVDEAEKDQQRCRVLATLRNAEIDALKKMRSTAQKKASKDVGAEDE
jgi:hypothetical protein